MEKKNGNWSIVYCLRTIAPQFYYGTRIPRVLHIKNQPNKIIHKKKPHLGGLCKMYALQINVIIRVNVGVLHNILEMIINAQMSYTLMESWT